MSDTSADTGNPATICCEPTCCAGGPPARPAAAVTNAVREAYGKTAKGGLSSNDEGVRAVAEAFGSGMSVMA